MSPPKSKHSPTNKLKSTPRGKKNYLEGSGEPILAENMPIYFEDFALANRRYEGSGDVAEPFLNKINFPPLVSQNNTIAGSEKKPKGNIYNRFGYKYDKYSQTKFQISQMDFPPLPNSKNSVGLQNRRSMNIYGQKYKKKCKDEFHRNCCDNGTDGNGNVNRSGSGNAKGKVNGKLNATCVKSFDAKGSRGGSSEKSCPTNSTKIQEKISKSNNVEKNGSDLMSGKKFDKKVVAQEVEFPPLTNADRKFANNKSKKRHVKNKYVSPRGADPAKVSKTQYGKIENGMTKKMSGKCSEMSGTPGNEYLNFKRSNSPSDKESFGLASDSKSRQNSFTEGSTSNKRQETSGTGRGTGQGLGTGIGTGRGTGIGTGTSSVLGVNDYGLLGLSSAMRSPESSATQFMLTKGFCLNEFGIDFESPFPLYERLLNPLLEKPLAPLKKASYPRIFTATSDNKYLKYFDLRERPEDTVFFIFYKIYDDFFQQEAARELQRRGWRFCKSFDTWINRIDGENYDISENSVVGKFYVFDILLEKRFAKILKISLNDFGEFFQC